MSRIDLLQSRDGINEESKVRSELRELKKAVFVKAVNGSVPDRQNTQDYLAHPGRSGPCPSSR
jgi:hypothetical protein